MWGADHNALGTRFVLAVSGLTPPQPACVVGESNPILSATEKASGRSRLYQAVSSLAPSH